MFNRSNNARIEKEINSKNSLEGKPDKKTGTISAVDTYSSISVRTPDDAKTIIGEGVVIDGKISGSGNLIIEGLMKGNVELEGSSITVGPKGRIEGEIIAKDAVISGQMYGKINAEGTVNIAQNADFCGDIKAKSISIDNGAFFKGKIEMDREPSRNIETDEGLMVKPGSKQNKVSPMPTAEPIR